MIRLRSSRIIRTAIAVGSAAVASASFVAATPAPASADTLGGVILCTASLPVFPGNSSGTCNGTATGVHDGSALIASPFSSSFTYQETCPPVVGTAQGTTSIGPSFSWTRVGLTAVLILNHSGSTSGAAAGLFVPTTVLPASALAPPCAGAGPTTAQVVTVGVDAL